MRERASVEVGAETASQEDAAVRSVEVFLRRSLAVGERFPSASLGDPSTTIRQSTGPLKLTPTIPTV